MNKSISQIDRSAVAGVRSACRRSHPGFTLLELVLVMLILAVLAGMIAPSLSGFAWSRRGEDTATTVRAMISWAKSRAAEEGREYRLEIAENRDGAAVIRLMAQDGGTYVYPGHSLAKAFEIPIGQTVEWEAPTEAASTGYISIRSDGTHDAGRLRITEQNGRVLFLRSQSLTEPWRLMTTEQADSEGLLR